MISARTRPIGPLQPIEARYDLVEVNGHCDPRFARVRDALADNLAAGKEVGASLYVNIDGEEVVDLWGGWRDKELQRAVDP